MEVEVEVEGGEEAGRPTAATAAAHPASHRILSPLPGLRPPSHTLCSSWEDGDLGRGRVGVGSLPMALPFPLDGADGLGASGWWRVEEKEKEEAEGGREAECGLGTRGICAPQTDILEGSRNQNDNILRGGPPNRPLVTSSRPWRGRRRVGEGRREQMGGKGSEYRPLLSIPPTGGGKRN